MEIFVTVQDVKDVRTPDTDQKLAETVSLFTKMALLVTDSDYEPALVQVNDAEGTISVEFQLFERD